MILGAFLDPFRSILVKLFRAKSPGDKGISGPDKEYFVHFNFSSVFGLRGRVFLILAALVLITLGGGAVMMWYTFRMERLFTSVVEMNVAALQAAEELETALLSQRGFVSYYFLDGNPEWLVQLKKYREAFAERLKTAEEIDRTESGRSVLSLIQREYNDYIIKKDDVIALYKSGKREESARLHQEVRSHLFKILNLCEEYKSIHSKRINLTWEETRVEAGRLRIIAATAMSAAVFLGGLLSIVLMFQILGPIRRLAFDTGRSGATSEDVSEDVNEMVALKRRVRGLIEDVDHTQVELEKSREKLLQSEKMALVGKLAAEVAHSIRNPMTSIKLRLFSLERTLDLTPNQSTDFDVISKEMRHLDTIVRNFLEFSRPPKLKMRKVDVSDVVDMTLELLQNRIEHHNVRVDRQRGEFLPPIDADPEQLKEVLVNLIVNACEAMGKSGHITIAEEDAVAEKIGRAVLVRITDTGPGIPESIRDKVMEPFFSTKEDGTGLGLAIAARIVEEHGGRLDLRSGESWGTTFIITLPVAKEAA
jgi:signal transduction histidine kinase